MKPIQTLRNSFLSFSSGQNCLIIFKVKKACFRLVSFTVVKGAAHPTFPGPGKHQILEEKSLKYTGLQGEMVFEVGIFLHQVSLTKIYSLSFCLRAFYQYFPAYFWFTPMRFLFLVRLLVLFSFCH
jgi:hypothetical protein